MDLCKVSVPWAFIKMCKQYLSILHTEEMDFLKEFVESMGGTLPPAAHKDKSEENVKEKKTVRRWRKTMIDELSNE